MNSRLAVVGVEPKLSYAVEDFALFPTQVQILRWRTEPGFNERLSRVCKDLHRKISEREHGYEDYNLWTETAPEIDALKDMFLTGMTAYIKTHFRPEVLRDYDYEMHAWLRIDKPKQILAPHTHPLANLIATYYCQVDIAARKEVPTGYGRETLIEGDLELRDPRAGNQRRYSKSDGLFGISPEPGMMVIIPNFLPHWVSPASSGDVRISIANDMNFRKKVPIGVLGSFE